MTRSREFVAKARGFIAAGLLVACKPDAMSYCRALETRDLAKECKEDAKADSGKAAVFKARDGSAGRVLLTTNDDYFNTIHTWHEREQAGEMYVSGRPQLGLLIAMPATLDVFDREEFTSFGAYDIDRVAEKKELEARPRPKEHPVRSAACEADGKCSGAGLCSTLPSSPNNGIAGFDADCRKSANCASEKLCKANAKTGLCSHP